MKFFRIFTILFVVATLYVMRDDIGFAFEKLQGDASSLYNAVIKSASSVTSPAKDVVSNEGTVEPGPLVVLAKHVKDASVPDKDLTIKEIIAETNRYRAEVGLRPLTENTLLDASALVKTADMLRGQYFEHVSPDGKSVADLALESGYEYIVIGENLAMGNFQNSKDVVLAWYNSPGHRANMLNSRYTDIGIGIIHGIYKGQKVWMAVQHFGLPKTVCPEVKDFLRQTIESNQKILKEYEAAIEKDRGVIQKGDAVLRPDYATLINNYNVLVEKYNSLARATKKLVETYNQSVKDFNHCADPSLE